MAERISEKILSKTYVRSIPRHREELWRLALEFKVDGVDQEDLMVAAWFWLRSLPLDQLKKDLRPIIQRVIEEKARYIAEQTAVLKANPALLYKAKSKFLDLGKPPKGGKKHRMG